MKFGWMKRVVAIGICAAMLLSENVFSTAFASVSDGDAANIVQESETASVSGNNLVTSVSGSDLTEVEPEESEPEEVETEETATEDAESEEAELEETEEEQGDIVLVTEASGVTITLTAPAGSLPEEAELWAEEIDKRSQLKMIDKALEAEAEKEEIEVQEYKAFDIKILVDGEEIQPTEGVTVSFAGDILLPQTAEEEVAVYHVTEDAVANNMGATVTEANEVEMETTHFSIYVITVSLDASSFSYDVTIQHKLASNVASPFYKDDVQTVTKEDNLLIGEQGGGDYNVTSVVIKESNDTPAITVAANDINIVVNEDGRFLDLNMDTYEISSDTVVTVYYEPVTNTFTSDVTFFDYSVMSDDGTYVNGGINSNIYNADGSQKSNYLGMGMNGYHTSVLNVINRFDDNNLLDANANNTNNPDNNWAPEYDHLAIAEGLVAGLSSKADGYQTVSWGTAADGQPINAPEYFSSNAVEGKTILNDRFDLQFSQNGHTYVLNGSIDNGNNGAFTAAGKGNAGFFPLNAVEHNDTAAAIKAAGGSGEIYNSLVREHEGLNMDSEKGNNCYFGMRYDFKFTIGGYVGPLQYTFEGDDDLWVFMDGQLVLDLGGLHSAYPSAYPDADTADGIASPVNHVDLWQYIKDANGNYDTGKEHQITVLYMERGGYDSTCYMEFTLPNATAMKSVISTIPTVNLEVEKREEGTEKVIAGVGFTLYADAACTTVAEAQKTTDAAGKVTFDGLRAGTYYLKETKYDKDLYEVDNTVHTVTVTSDGATATLSVAGLNKNGNAYVVYNKPIPTVDIEFKKIDRFYPNHSMTLAGAQFTLKENDINGKVIATSKVTEADGLFTFSGLKEGTYFMEEIQAPAGYRLPVGEGLIIVVTDRDNNDVLEYSITSTNTNLMYYMKDGNGVNIVKNMKGVDVTITKEWVDYKGNELEEVPVSEITVELHRKWYDEGMGQWRSVWYDANTNKWPDDSYVQDVTLSAENNWTVTLEDLDYRCDGGVWTYYVEEKTVVDGYTVEYSDAVVNTNDQGENSIQLGITNKQNPGSLTITKTVDKINMAYGAPTFTFKIVGPEGVLYRTITFDDANVTTKSITIDDILVGKYTVTELDTLRYTLNEEKSSYSAAVVTDTVTPEFSFYNELTNDDDYSHSDVVVNGFRQNDNGEIEVSKNLQVIE